MEAKSKKVNWKNLDVPIKREGKHITLPSDPADMPTEEAIEALKRKLEDENQEFDVFERFDAYPLDAAVAFVKAMQERYGWALSSNRMVETLFGQAEVKPDMVTVQTGPKPDDKMQVPIGAFQLPGVESPIEALINPGRRRETPFFFVRGTVKKKDQHIVLELVEIARRILRENSIYRGKALHLHVDDDGDLDQANPPTFIDLSGVNEEELILNETTRNLVDVALFTPMRETSKCLEHGIPLKRGILLEGPYGCGKTLTARLAAKVAEDNGWTFIMLNRVQGLEEALRFAERYQPAVVFAEDVDRIVNERDNKTNDLINTVDGVLSKDSKVITVLTTNHLDQIEPVMLRPGRLDAVISVHAPDADSVDKLIRYFARGLLEENDDLSQVCEQLAGQIPATIREVVERAKLGMIARGATSINHQDLVTSALGMTGHLEALNRQNTEETPADKLASGLKGVLSNGHGDMQQKVNDLHEAIC